MEIVNGDSKWRFSRYLLEILWRLIKDLYVNRRFIRDL